MAQIVATMYSNLLITPKNSTIAVGAPPTKGDHLLVNDALLSGGAAAGELPVYAIVTLNLAIVT